MGTGVFQQKEPKMPGAHKIGAAISGPVTGEFQVTVCSVTGCPFSRHKEIGGPNAFKTRLKCTCHEIVLSVTRQT